VVLVVDGERGVSYTARVVKSQELRVKRGVAESRKDWSHVRRVCCLVMV
jgi:hypothetical protein